MSELYTFPCGCRFPVLGEPAEPGGLPLLDYDVDEAARLYENCPATWALLARGLTKGVFQLESPLGRQWSRKVRPESLEHMGALGALLRPGPLQAKDEHGVSLTEHYARRKNGEEEVEDFHPALREVLGSTYGILTYQEQSMLIARDLAGFSMADVERLRKGIGKKVVELVNKICDELREGFRKTGRLDDKAGEVVAEWVKKTGRYQFNKCVHKHTLICRAPGQPGPDRTVEEMYRIRHDRAYAQANDCYDLHARWSQQGHYGLGLSMCPDGVIRPNTIEDIQPAGVRPLWRVTLVNGAFIEATGNHRFPTLRGEMTVDQLRADGGINYLRLCGRLGWFENTTTVFPALTMSIASIEPAGEAETYDVTMAAPHHNFVVGTGIVTCNSHAVSYGVTGYKTAYAKAHCPVGFFASWLKWARQKSDPREEMAELVGEAKLFDVAVEPPDLRLLESRVSVHKGTIYLGLSDVKHVGEQQVEALRQAVRAGEVEQGAPLPDWSWWQLLMVLVPRVPVSLLVHLVECGALRHWKGHRRRQLAEVQALGQLTAVELDWLRQNGQGDVASSLRALGRPRRRRWEERVARPGNERELRALERVTSRLQNELAEAEAQGAEAPAVEAQLKAARKSYLKLTQKVQKETPPPWGGCSSGARESLVASLASLLERPPSPLVDTPHWLAWAEEQGLGVSLSCSSVDGCDLSEVNCSCKDFFSGRTGYLVLGVVVKSVREVRVRNGEQAGQTMAFLTVEDGTCSLPDVVCFAETWKDLKGTLREGAEVIVHGEREARREKKSLIIKAAWPAKLAGQ